MKPILTLFAIVCWNFIHAQEPPRTLNKRKKPGTVGTTVQNANTTSNIAALSNSSPDILMRLKLPFNRTEKDYYVKKQDHLYILNGDIIVGNDYPKTMSVAINNADFRWPNATIPIVIDPSVASNGATNSVLDAIREFNSKTELCLVPRTNEADFVRIIVDNTIDGGGNSAVGKQGGGQVLKLASGQPASVVIHELMHAAGFYHEQCRSDRDTYVSIKFENVEERLKHNFQIEDDGVPIGKYDYCSIMHYPPDAFQKKDATGPTIMILNRQESCIPGSVATFSQDDINAIDMFYSNVSRFPCNTPFPGMSPRSEMRFPTVNISASDKAQESFRHRATYASQNGFAAGFPNFHEATQGINIVGGTILIKHGMVVWQDVPINWLGNPPLNDFAARMRATQQYAVRNGFVGGFPNYFHADKGGVTVCGTFLLTNEVAEFRDVPLSELGNPPLDDIRQRFTSANDYAFRNGFLGGFPTFYHADYGRGIVCGIILIRKVAGEWRDVIIATGPR